MKPCTALLALGASISPLLVFAQAPSTPQNQQIASMADPPPAPAAGRSIAPTGAAAAEAPVTVSDCGDVLSAALHVDTYEDMPCWANIRATERWNVADIPDGGGLHGANSPRLPLAQTSRFNIAAGALAATDFLQGHAFPVYSGNVGVAGFLDRNRWQLAVEDVGALASNGQVGGRSFAGLNRAAIRFGSQPSQRLTWQASATNTFGTDGLRVFAPLDERRIGSQDSSSQLPVADSVSYGLHVGNVTDEQEDLHLRYEQTRRSNWEFAAGHTLLHYSDDGVTVQSLRGRAEFLHAWNDHTALGFFGHTERQNDPAGCSLTGGGIRSISTWNQRASLNVSAAASASDTACGRNVTFTGDAAFSLSATSRTSFAFTANRGLSDGVIERVALLNTAVVGIRHSFASLVDLKLSAAGIMGNDVLTHQTYTGTFVTAGVTYPVGTHLMGETSVRHLEVTPIPQGDNRTVLITTLWFTPKSRALNGR